MNPIVVLQLALLLLGAVHSTQGFVVGSTPSYHAEPVRVHLPLLHASSTNQTAERVSRQQRWDQRIEELEQYHKQFGTYNVPRTHIHKKDEWATPARWLQSVRTRQSRLPKDRKDQLIAMGVNLNGTLAQLEKRDQQWNEMLGRLVEYNNTHGDANVPQKYPADPTLGTWVNTQRRMFWSGKLSPEREKKLRSINFEFKLKFKSEYDMSKHDQKWYWKLGNMTIFHAEHGHFWPYERSSNATVRSLGLWCRDQRSLNREGLLRQDRFLELQKIDFPWDEKEAKDSQWFARFEDLKQILEKWKREGRGGNAYSANVLGKGLYCWVLRQQDYNMNETLDPKRKELLDDIGFEWEFSFKK